jgi:hypothetical protein
VTPMAALNRVTDPEAREVLLRLAAEHAQFRGRLIATAGVPCVKDASWKRWPMKCLPKDPCSFCRAREALRGVEEGAPPALVEALRMHVEVYGGADHHPQDCENSETCLQCRADALVNEALRGHV